MTTRTINVPTKAGTKQVSGFVAWIELSNEERFKGFIQFEESRNGRNNAANVKLVDYRTGRVFCDLYPTLINLSYKGYPINRALQRKVAKVRALEIVERNGIDKVRSELSKYPTLNT